MDCRGIRSRRERPTRGPLLIPYWFLVHWCEVSSSGPEQLIKGCPHQLIPRHATLGVFERARRRRRPASGPECDARGNGRRSRNWARQLVSNTKPRVLLQHAGTRWIPDCRGGVCSTFYFFLNRFHLKVLVRRATLWQARFKSCSSESIFLFFFPHPFLCSVMSYDVTASRQG